MDYSTQTNQIKKEELPVASKIKENKIDFKVKMVSIDIDMHKQNGKRGSRLLEGRLTIR